MTALRLFEGFGIELEYMIVNRDTLDVYPCCDRLMSAVAGGPVSDYDEDAVSWSNELALHVVEIKTNGPAKTLKGLGARFQETIGRVNAALEPMGAMVLPTAMHPWMEPHRETRLWPHEYTDIYRTYDRIFDCSGHGWSNVQSTHINLPFTGDEEFGRLHAAIRLVLPLLPALAASSPIVESKRTHALDNRLHFYKGNQSKVPSIAGNIIPEEIYTEGDYRSRIYDRVRIDIAPHDPEGKLSAEFLNSRGAIARFDRGAIEIRLLDIQECPEADIAVCALVIETVRALVNEKWSPLLAQQGARTELLAGMLDATVLRANHTLLLDQHYLSLFGILKKEITAGDIWRHLYQELATELAPWKETIETMLQHGPLSDRILRALPAEPGREDLAHVYRQLATCLAQGRPYIP